MISFEEDIAKIASIVLVVSESAGSLSELGAFASEEGIRDHLRIIISEEHSKADSFVRYGPVKRIENINRDRIGIFPWKSTKNGRLVKASLKGHFQEVCKFINGHIDGIPHSYGYDKLNSAAIFYDIIWVLSIFDAVPPEPLYQIIRQIHPDFTDSEIRDKLYVLKTCGWVDVFSYANRDFYFLPVNKDPFEYSFHAGQRVRDVAARLIEVAQEFREQAGIGKAIQKRLLAKRRGL